EKKSRGAEPRPLAPHVNFARLKGKARTSGDCELRCGKPHVEQNAFDPAPFQSRRSNFAGGRRRRGSAVLLIRLRRKDWTTEGQLCPPMYIRAGAGAPSHSLKLRPRHHTQRMP